MMRQQKSRKILIYTFLLIIIATFNNKNLSKINLLKVENIFIKGLDEKKNSKLIQELNFLKDQNIFFLDKFKIKKIIESNELVDKYSIFKLYPSSINILIKKTNFLASTKKVDDSFLIGSNGKLIRTKKIDQNLPVIFGDFEVKNFFDLKNAIDETKFDFNDVKNLFFFKSGRWDIETKYGLTIKLPKDEVKKSLQILINFIDAKDLSGIKEVDLRQSNQIITNG